MALLQRARAVAIIQGAREQLADVDTTLNMLKSHLRRWKQGYANMLLHIEAMENRSAASANEDAESSDTPCLRSQIVQDKEDMQKIADCLKNFDPGTAVIQSELEELRTADCRLFRNLQAPSTESYSSEQRRLYHLSCQRLKTVQVMQSATRRARAAVAAVLGRLVHGTLHQDRQLLRITLLSWQLCVTRQLKAAHAQQLCLSEDQSSAIQHHFLAHSYALFQIQSHKHGMWLKQAVFISWNRQLWLSVRGCSSLWAC